MARMLEHLGISRDADRTVSSDDVSIVSASMEALDFYERAWASDATASSPPDPAALSDRGLVLVARYDADDLPAAVRETIETEARRRGMSVSPREMVLAVAAMAVPSVAGIAIGWELFVP